VGGPDREFAVETEQGWLTYINVGQSAYDEFVEDLRRRPNDHDYALWRLVGKNNAELKTKPEFSSPPPPPAKDEYSVSATGDVVVGDIIKFNESVFVWSFKKAKYKGERTVEAEVVKDSYGAKTQQHTFTLKIISAQGIDAYTLPPGKLTTRKGRNLYKKGVNRKPWPDESKRETVADEKHLRGKEARDKRQRRLFGEE